MMAIAPANKVFFDAAGPAALLFVGLEVPAAELGVASLVRVAPGAAVNFSAPAVMATGFCKLL